MCKRCSRHSPRLVAWASVSSVSTLDTLNDTTIKDTMKCILGLVCLRVVRWNAVLFGGTLLAYVTFALFCTSKWLKASVCVVLFICSTKYHFRRAHRQYSTIVSLWTQCLGRCACALLLEIVWTVFTVGGSCLLQPQHSPSGDFASCDFMYFLFLYCVISFWRCHQKTSPLRLFPFLIRVLSVVRKYNMAYSVSCLSFSVGFA